MRVKRDDVARLKDGADYLSFIDALSFVDALWSVDVFWSAERRAQRGRAKIK